MGCIFWENLGLKRACNLSDLLNKEQAYLNYEKELITEEGEMGRETGNIGYSRAPERYNGHRKEDEDCRP